MRPILTLCLLAALFMFSCTKTNTITNTVTVNDTIKVTVKDTLTIINTDTLGSNFDYITAHTWMYNLYYIGYVDSTHLGILQYQRGATNNTMDLDNARTTYNPNATITELDQNGGSTPGTWYFANNTETLLTQQNATGIYNATIVKLDSSHFYWYSTAVDGTVRYAEYIPAQ